jgi:hypothetical protein
MFLFYVVRGLDPALFYMQVREAACLTRKSMPQSFHDRVEHVYEQAHDVCPNQLALLCRPIDALQFREDRVTEIAYP